MEQDRSLALYNKYKRQTCDSNVNDDDNDIDVDSRWKRFEDDTRSKSNPNNNNNVNLRRFVRGSQEAKEYMASIRNLRGKSIAKNTKKSNLKKKPITKAVSGSSKDKRSKIITINKKKYKRVYSDDDSSSISSYDSDSD